MQIQCDGAMCTAHTTDPSGLCPRCLRRETDKERRLRERRQNEFKQKFSAGAAGPRDEAGDKSRSLAAEKYARGFLRSATGYGTSSPDNLDHGTTYEPLPVPDGRPIFCKQCNGDGGATGSCPRCGGDGFEPNR